MSAAGNARNVDVAALRKLISGSDANQAVPATP